MTVGLLYFPIILTSSRWFVVPVTDRKQLVRIWHITLQLDDQNHGTSLSATRLSFFPRENCGSLLLISLLGRYIAFGVGIHSNDIERHHYIAIVDWAEANIQSQSHRNAVLKLSYPRKIILLHFELVSRSIGSLFACKLTHKVNRVWWDYSREEGYV